MAAEGPERLTGCRLPQPHRFVLPAAGQGLAVRAEGDAAHVARMPLEGADLPPRLDVPELEHAVAGERLAVRAEADREDGGPTPGNRLEGTPRRARLHIPEGDLPVRAAARQQIAAGRKGDRVEARAPRGDGAEFLPGP